MTTDGDDFSIADEAQLDQVHVSLRRDVDAKVETLRGLIDEFGRLKGVATMMAALKMLSANELAADLLVVLMDRLEPAPTPPPINEE